MTFLLSSAIKIVLAAQITSASLAGTVRDEESGAPLPGAVVALADLDRFQVTDAYGHYAFMDVPAGPQHVTVRLLGYAPRALHALVPRQGAVEINIALKPEPIAIRAIEVRTGVPVRGIDAGDGPSPPDHGITAAAVRHHPLLAEPDFFQAIEGGEVMIQPESPSGVHVRSGASDQTAYLLDGIPVFSPYHTAGTFSAWNPDALSELSLAVSPPFAGFADALSGVVSAVTRSPGTIHRMHGSLSTTQARLTLDGPLGLGSAGYLVSLRASFPGFIIPRNEGTYLRSDTGDWLAKIEAPVLGGRLRVLGYNSENEVDVLASAAEEDVPVLDPARNLFIWESRSFGGEWLRPAGGAEIRVRAWSAAGDASADWRREDGTPERLSAERRDEGVIATVERSSADRTTLAGIQTRWSRTSYRITPDSVDGPAFALSARTPVTAAFLHHSRSVGARTRAELGVIGALAEGSVRWGPSARLRWEPWSSLVLTGTYARTHQLAQSLRNPESVVGNVFPADLYVGAGAPGVPVGRSDQGILSAEVRPIAGLLLEAEAYERDFDGLLLVAPRDADPFVTGGFVVGSGRARGGSLGLAVSSARYAALASYGFQHVRLEYGDTTYTPNQGVAHRIDAGVILFPTVTSSISLGAASVLGRRTTSVAGFFEWEACNLLDQGCEFAGSPQDRTEPLGATSLPAYVRLDLGLRKHWHLEVGGRDGLVTLFGTLTNLMGRGNVLTVARDPATDQRTEVTMRPRSPLVVGVDWHF